MRAPSRVFFLGRISAARCRFERVPAHPPSCVLLLFVSRASHRRSASMGAPAVFVLCPPPTLLWQSGGRGTRYFSCVSGAVPLTAGTLSVQVLCCEKKGGGGRKNIVLCFSHYCFKGFRAFELLQILGQIPQLFRPPPYSISSDQPRPPIVLKPCSPWMLLEAVVALVRRVICITNNVLETLLVS